MPYRIIVIDDDESSRESISSYLNDLEYETYSAEDGFKGINLVKLKNPDLVITDINMPGMSGIEVLTKIKEFDELIQVIVITAYDDMNSTIAAMQQGAYDYLEKPVDILRLKLSIKRALENRKLSQKLESYTPEVDSETVMTDTLIGKSPQMRNIYKKIGQASASRVTVLIQAESGTGKELIAKIIHNSGITKSEPFIAINCTALPENLLESELFGHMKGSFTDAIKDKRGKFELAGKGTIFLDEISEMSFNLQAKILRVLQEHVFERVGGETLLEMKARIITATNKDLLQLVNEGKFREDLYYRLNVFTISPPSLRSRKEDIELLVRHFLMKINTMLHKNVRKIPDDVFEILKNHEWKGNVRELENTLMQAIVLSRGDVLEKENLLLSDVRKEETFDSLIGSNVKLEDIEKKHIELILQKTDWDIRAVSEILGISRATLYRKIELFRLTK
ncbi:MAG TPA: sigma-54 dependent transcriptional regulator [Ignavibacteria bacterium]